MPAADQGGEGAGPEEPILNGRDFSGWVFRGVKTRLEDAVHIKDGVVFCRSVPGNRLRTKASFSDFALRLDYRFPEGSKTRGNGCAVLLRMPDDEKAAEAYLRVKLGDWTTGRVFLPHWKQSQTTEKESRPLALAKAEKPAGEWNSLEVVCLVRKVAVKLNGEAVGSLDVDTSKEGFIGLAPQGCDVEFRTVRVARISR